MHFSEYYSQEFGDTWPDLEQELLRPTVPIIRFAPGYSSDAKQLFEAAKLAWQPLERYIHAIRWPEGLPLNESITNTLPGIHPDLLYIQNASSLEPVLQLDPKPGDVVLDACAAPGGKASFIAELLDGQGELLATDASNTRVQRLRSVLEPRAQAFSWTNLTAKTAKAEVLFKTYSEYFTHILLDAPCSSEKHVITSTSALAEWTPSRIKQLQFRQYALLAGILLALQPGGKLVYSTCAINYAENERVVEKFIKKKGSQIALVHQQRIVPGAVAGIDYDPMFIAVFQKIV